MSGPASWGVCLFGCYLLLMLARGAPKQSEPQNPAKLKGIRQWKL